jgi:hypothetical protein
MYWHCFMHLRPVPVWAQWHCMLAVHCAESARSEQVAWQVPRMFDHMQAASELQVDGFVWASSQRRAHWPLTGAHCVSVAHVAVVRRLHLTLQVEVWEFHLQSVRAVQADDDVSRVQAGPQTPRVVSNKQAESWLHVAWLVEYLVWQVSTQVAEAEFHEQAKGLAVQSPWLREAHFSPQVDVEASHMQRLLPVQASCVLNPGVQRGTHVVVHTQFGS